MMNPKQAPIAIDFWCICSDTAKIVRKRTVQEPQVSRRILRGNLSIIRVEQMEEIVRTTIIKLEANCDVFL